MYSGSASTTPAALTTTARGNIYGRKTVIKELEEVFRKGKHTPEGRLDELTPKEKKHIINKNMLAARQRWVTQNREKSEALAAIAVSSSTGGSDDSENEDPPETAQPRRGLAHSCEPTISNKIERNGSVEQRANRTYSNTTSNRIIPNPPRNPPPSLTNPLGTSHSTTALAAGAKTQPMQKVASKEGNVKKECSGNIAAASKMKKIFKFKPKKKKRRTKKMTSIPTTRVGSIKGDKAGISKKGIRMVTQKSMSDSYLSINNVLMRTSSLEDEITSVPTCSLEYQNVFDNPEFAKYTQKPPSRSNTSSPMEASKPPKPLPRLSFPTVGKVSMLSTGSDRETDPEAPSPFQTKMSVVSPLMSSSPNSDCLTPVLTSPLMNDDDISSSVLLHSKKTSLPQICLELGDNSASNQKRTKERLAKTTSCNPDANGWGINRRDSSQKQKELRRGVCSEGPQEDYVSNSSILETIAPQPMADLLHANSLGNARDSYRLSATYLKLLPSLLEQDKMSQESAERREGGQKQTLPPPVSGPQKVNSVPSLNGYDSTDCETPPLEDCQLYHEVVLEDRFLTRSTTPSSSIQTRTPKPEQEEVLRRNPQYIAVTVKTAANKKRKPSVPKKFKYQMVAIGEDGDPKLRGKDGVGSDTAKHLPVGTSSDQQQPLSTSPFETRQSPTDNSHRYYVNRNSLGMMRNSKELPTTMLKTVDPYTGKIIWHEYVEIDENEINQIAKSMGVSPTNISLSTPDNLDSGTLSSSSEDSKKDDEENDEQVETLIT